MKNTNTLLILITIVVIGLIIWLGFFKKETPVLNILSFKDCETAQFPVTEGKPRQCKTPDGRTFAEEIPEKITYLNATINNITVETPFPGAVTGKSFSVVGKARGTWFFEASFPVEVLDKNGNVLVVTPAQAQSEWMTENFVPFKVEMKVPDSYIGPATLVLNKDNPSGLPEHDASISFPITIEY